MGIDIRFAMSSSPWTRLIWVVISISMLRELLAGKHYSGLQLRFFLGNLLAESIDGFSLFFSVIFCKLGLTTNHCGRVGVIIKFGRR
jgi:hypothetical protein